ncbi:PIN domain-containing protein [Methylobacter sp. YRD-M1]|nr:PIN domain-containing protein [Methylobacter sp. YRD-M1]
MENGGKNSADFGICFFAGVLMQSLPKETHFVIVSNDTDLDHVIRLLISQERSAERIGKKKEDVQANACEKNGPLSAYCAHLISHGKNRPTKEATLVNSIKSKFNDTPSIATNILGLLLNQSAIRIENGKVIYNEQRIISLANTNH